MRVTSVTQRKASGVMKVGDCSPPLRSGEEVGSDPWLSCYYLMVGPAIMRLINESCCGGDIKGLINFQTVALTYGTL